jgi:predicted GNAT family acetyltransferase
MSITFKHIDDNNEGRFIVEYEGQEAGYIKYKWLENGNINANGTLVYDTFKDKKLGMPLFNQLIGFAREKGIKIYPTCPFVVKMFSRMPELNDLLADDYVRP